MYEFNILWYNPSICALVLPLSKAIQYLNEHNVFLPQEK